VLVILISSFWDQEVPEEKTKERWGQEDLIARVREKGKKN